MKTQQIIRTLILDDNLDELALLDWQLKKEEVENYTLFSDEKKFLATMTDGIHVVVLDHKLRGNITGLDIVKLVKARNRENFVITFTSILQPDILLEYLNIINSNMIDRFLNKDIGIVKAVEFLRDGITEAKRRLIFYNYFQEQLDRTS